MLLARPSPVGVLLAPSSASPIAGISLIRAICCCQVGNRWRPAGATEDRAPQRSGQGLTNEERKDKKRSKKAEKKERQRARHAPRTGNRSRSSHSDNGMSEEHEGGLDTSRCTSVARSTVHR